MDYPELQVRTTPHRVIVIAASAGGIAALEEVLGGLPKSLNAAIAVVQHRAPTGPSYLGAILTRAASMPVRDAEEGEILKPGIIFLAPPDRHLIVREDAGLNLLDSPKVKFCRPAADELFISAATSFKERVIGVILTGYDGDGTLGAERIKTFGGTMIAQDKASSFQFSMPHSAIKAGYIDHILTLGKIAPKLRTLCEKPCDLSSVLTHHLPAQ